MNRTHRLKILYVVVLLALLALALLLAAALFPALGLPAMFAVGLLLFVPGRIQGVFFRDFFRGRRLLDSGQPAEALVPFRRFLAHVQRKPRQKRLLWLGWGIYSTDIEAMTWNNIGAAHTELGEWSAAREALGKAIAIDREYPIPHFNLALIASAEGRPPGGAARGRGGPAARLPRDVHRSAHPAVTVPARPYRGTRRRAARAGRLIGRISRPARYTSLDDLALDDTGAESGRLPIE